MQRALPIALVLLVAGCVAPAADVAPASLAILESVHIEGATSAVLPNGDRALTLVGEVAGLVEHEFTLPVGVTYVEAVSTALDAPVAVTMRNAASKAGVCMPQSWIGWYETSDERRCTAIASMDPGATWTLRILGGSAGSAGGPGGLMAQAPRAVPYEVTLTFSTAPLDGSAAAIKLDALSKPVLEAQETFSEKVAASADGALLNVEVTLPDAPGPFPTVMMASPYVTSGRAADGRAHNAAIAYWTARGYAFVTMDLRGTGTSAGCYSGRGAVDQTDTADAVEWVAAQEWSDGKIGMMGFSYVGFTPVAAAVQQPPHLTTIYIGGAAVDMWSNYRPGGVETGRTASTMLVGYAVSEAAQTTPDDNPLGPAQYTADAFCDPSLMAGVDPRGLYDAWWAQRNLTPMAHKIQVPVAIEQGLWDNNVKSNYVPELFAALEVPKRLLVGPWQHIWAYRADQALRVQAWMDHWLKGIDTGIMDTPVVEVISSDGRHRAADVWPAMDTTPYTLDLDPASFITLPPALSFTAQLGTPSRTATAPLEGDVYLAGIATIDMTLALPQGGTALLEARVYEETAEGDLVLAGAGWMNAAHRDGHDKWTPFAPGESDTIHLRFMPQEHLFRAGSRIVVEIMPATDTWGGPEAALNAPTRVDMSAATLTMPTLPSETLGPRPRSAS